MPYGSLLGRPYDPAALPEIVREYAEFAAGRLTSGHWVSLIEAVAL